MPLEPNFRNVSLCAWSNFTAGQGMLSPLMYSSMAAWSRSELTKTNSKSGCLGLKLLYHSTSFGVNMRQGGHQWAEK